MDPNRFETDDYALVFAVGLALLALGILLIEGV